MGRVITRARDPCWYLEIPASVVSLWDECLSDAESLVCKAGAAGKEGTCGPCWSAGWTERSYQCSKD